MCVDMCVDVFLRSLVCKLVLPRFQTPPDTRFRDDYCNMLPRMSNTLAIFAARLRTVKPGAENCNFLDPLRWWLVIMLLLEDA